MVPVDLKDPHELHRFFTKYMLAAKVGNQALGTGVVSVAFDGSSVVGRRTLVAAYVLPDGCLTWCPPQETNAIPALFGKDPGEGDLNFKPVRIRSDKNPLERHPGGL